MSTVSTQHKFDVSAQNERAAQDCVRNGMGVSGSYNDKAKAIKNRLKDKGYEPHYVLIVDGWDGAHGGKNIIIKHNVGSTTKYVWIIY